MLFNKLIIFIPSIAARNRVKKLFVIFEQWVTIHPARLFLLIAILWMSLMFFVNKKGEVEWKDIFVEANGMVFDLFVFGALLAWYDGKRQKNERIERDKNLIDDFRRWENEEGVRRTVGAIKRLNIENVTNIDLSHCFLEMASLEKARLNGAFIYCTNLRKANLYKAHLEAAILQGADLQGAFLDESHLEGAHLEGAHLEGAFLIGAHLQGASLVGTLLEGAALMGANLRGARLNGARLEGSHLQGADFHAADLNRVHLKGASVGIDWFEKLEKWKVKGREVIIEKYQITEGGRLQLK